MTDIFWPCGDLPFRLIAGMVTGLIFGSFATMLSYRLPRGISIILPRSHCPACKSALRPRDLVPLLSFAASRGKCRFCGVFTGWRYPAIEAVLMISTAAAFAILGCTVWFLIVLALTVIFVAAAAIFIEARRRETR
ncbi:MAG: prepilin peptidase [Methylocapsa sp.]|nr:prepilin peptidase [Methylocapsa sp.]